MDSLDFVWEHFKFNAEQRLRGFNFFILLSIFADGGAFTALEKQVSPAVFLLLGIFIILLAAVFCLIDTRSRGLLHRTIEALKVIEADFEEPYRVFAKDADAQGKIVRYTTAIRILLFWQSILGLGITCYGVYGLVRQFICAVIH